MNAIQRDLDPRDVWSYEDYDDYLDSEGEVLVCGLKFHPSRILSELDPIVYNVGYGEYLDVMQSNFPDQLIVWDCSECGQEYDNEDDAEQCCVPEEEV